MSTDSIIQKLRASTSGHSCESISSAEELQLAAQIRESELASHAKHLRKRNKLKERYEKRIQELEAALNEARREIEQLRQKSTSPSPDSEANYETVSLNALLDKIEEESDNEGSLSETDTSLDEERASPSKKRRLITEMNVSQAKYIDYLERFADMKCEEVDALIKRLLKMRKQQILANEQSTEVATLRSQLRRTQKENERLRERIADMKSSVRQFVLRHRESKADRRTRELHELAKLRAETELREFEFYAFVSAQLNQFMDKEYEVDEENAKKLVVMAAEMLRERKQECDV